MTEVSETFDDFLHQNSVNNFRAIRIELQTKKKAKAKMFVDFLQNEEKMEAVAFLTDITSHRNDFNVKLQGRNNTVTSCLWCMLFRGSWRCLNLTYRRELAALSKAFGTNLRKKITFRTMLSSWRS